MADEYDDGPTDVDQEPTIARCADCHRPVIVGGDRAPGAKGIAHALALSGSTACARGEGWSWCSRRRLYREVLSADDGDGKPTP